MAVCVVGAGIVGTSTALALQGDGHEVTLVDREGPGAGSSFGNAGAIVNASCAPTAMPGIVFDVYKMIGRPLAPFNVRFGYLPRAAPWMLRFLLESRLHRVRENARALHALTGNAVSAWHDLTHNTDLSKLLRPAGWLKVYESGSAFDRTRHARSLMDDLGVPYEILDADDIRELEPALAPHFVKGLLQRDSLQIVNPGKLVQGLADLFASRGGAFRKMDVLRIESAHDKPVVHGSGQSVPADLVVVAAGAWSGRLAAGIGDRVPLDTERGYHLMLSPENCGLLHRPVMHGDYSFVLSPMQHGLRLSSQVELAGIDAAPDYRRIRSLVPLARRMLPGIVSGEQSVWMGCRPSLPDSLPVLGYSPGNRRIVYAFGHQHLGMTLGPATAKIVADLVAGRSPSVDLRPYRADRF
ncbi:MAG TPA: FAD-dependent oxidoreductase [Woeseiaceae bacterium]|nr:FAD-dependent oxidoreductase [Woeseiaceae bacterium]